MWKSAAVFSVFGLLSVCAFGYDRQAGKPFASRSEVIARNGAAATSQPLATQVAIDILKQGGSAVDAAIAANAMLCLVEPVNCGIGGDLFAIVWDTNTQKLHGLNASGRSPYSLTLDHLKKQGLEYIPPLGPLPVSVPGCVDGWFELHRKFGRLPMKQVLAPAIRYAREGYGVTEVIALYWKNNAASIKDYPGFAETFMPGGRTPRKGEVFRNERLAATLEEIAEQGRDVFYKGHIARKIEAYMKENGGFLSYRDMADHTSEWVQPVSTTYRGHEIWELPPNGQGIAVLQMLNILEGFDLQSDGFGSVAHVHAFIEAKKLAFEDRARFYADPAFGRLPIAELISKDYAAKRRGLIDPQKAALRYDAGSPLLDVGDTIYLTTADGEGNMVSLIQSNYWGMGSGMTPGDLGFTLQNRGQMFALKEGHLNVYEPHKRPFHTIIPAFITKDGKPLMSFGVMGGAMQPQGHVQIVLHIVDFGMNLQEAGDAPRICHSGSSEPTGEVMTDGGRVHMESRFAAETVAALKKMGHTIPTGRGYFGGYQAIMWDAENKVYLAASESRTDGCAIGY